MTRHGGVFAVVVAGAIIAHAGVVGGAGGTISGTVKMAGTNAANALVYIEAAPGTFPPGGPVEMDQRGLKFVPRVLPIVAGTTVKFLNNDATTHNVFSPDYEKYDLGTWPQGQTKEYTFKECAKPPCVYAQLCKVHAEMDAYIAVMQNPYFAVTNKDGRYEIANVPPGSYMLGAWYAGRSLRYTAKPKAVTVDAAVPSVVEVVLSR
jgi:plastocyanin